MLACAGVLTVWLLRWRRLAALVRASTPITTGRIYDALVTALQEQLGLKLDARRATVDVMVIDSKNRRRTEVWRAGFGTASRILVSKQGGPAGCEPTSGVGRPNLRS